MADKIITIGTTRMIPTTWAVVKPFCFSGKERKQIVKKDTENSKQCELKKQHSNYHI